MKYSVFCLASLLMLGSMNNVIASKPAPLPSQDRRILNGVAYSWDCSNIKTDGVTAINITVADDGKLINPRIVHSSSNFQLDAECLEALCSLTPSLQPEVHEPTVETSFSQNGFTTRFYIGPPVRPFSNGSDIKSFLLLNPQPKNQKERFVVIHKIPLIVSKRYPYVFTQSELLSNRNLLKVKVGGSVQSTESNSAPQPGFIKTIADYYSYWGTLFAEPDVTREKILDWAEKASKLD